MSAAREQRDAHERADALAREGVHPPLPGVVVLDHERRARLPDAAGQAFAGRHARAELLLEHAGRDAALELLAVRAADVQVSVRRAQQLARAGEQLAQQIVDVEAVHHAERRLVQRAELGVLEAQLLGAVGDALLEPFQRLSQLGGHGVERRGEHADLVMRGDRRLAGEIAGGDRGRRLGDREDRLGDAPGEEIGADPEQEDDEQAEAADREAERARGREGCVLAHLRDERRSRLRQPAVGADHRHAAVVRRTARGLPVP